MDIQSIRTLLELKAMQNIGSTSDNSTVTNSDDTYFSELFSELLNSDNPDSLSNMLGSVATLANATSNTASLSNTSSSSDLASTNAYLASFLLNASESNLNASSSAALQQFTPDYTNQSGFSNIVSGAEKYADIISKAANTYNISEKLISAVMKQESNFNSNAKSASGASGLMQLMPSTAKYLGVTDISNTEQNVMAGAKYLSKLLKKYDNNVSLALAAYNAGPGNVDKYNGIPPFKETQKYVNNVMQYYQV